MRSSGSMCSSFQMPASPGEMRPRASTAAASVITRPAPPTARLPRWTRCQSVANPSTEEYWHMGETAMRLRKVTSRTVSGVNRFMSVPRRSLSHANQFPIPPGEEGVGLGDLFRRKMAHLVEQDPRLAVAEPQLGDE